MQKKIRTLTMYLPQFHRTVENDTWWGEGFTEWTAVRNALPLFKNHIQPKKPLFNNYYDLLDKEVMIWQADLMKKYGIDGQCFYHYYFKDGKKLLEKPAENLLKWKDIDMPFCFCWANDSWSRTWSNIRGNAWGDIFEKKDKGGSDTDGILMEQKYGREQEWKTHLEYLLPFFEDERYIKVDGKPVFMIYSPKEIYCLNQMIDYWNMLIEEYNIPPIFYIGMNSDVSMSKIDAILLHAPHAYWELKSDPEYNGIKTAEYEEVWNNIIDRAPIKNCKTYFGGVVNCDDTPRRGKNGVYLKNFNFDVFYERLCQLYRKSLFLGNEFVFLNAWNEWGEGMYLEPDEQNGYKYLECVKKAQMEVSVQKEYNFCFKEGYPKYYIERIEKQETRTRKITNCLDYWMYLKEKQISLAKYLERFSVKTVAVYGLGILGKHLLEEFNDSSIEIKYIIDQKSDLKHPEYKIIHPIQIDEIGDNVDAIIITPVWEFETIYKDIKAKTDVKIFSIEEIIFESQ